MTEKISIEKLIADMLKSIKTDKKSNHTYINYKSTYKQLVLYISEQEVNLISDNFQNIILDFIAYLSELYDSKVTITTKRTHVRQLVKFAYQNNLITDDFSGSIKSLKLDKGKEPKYLTLEQIKEIYEVAQELINEALDNWEIYKAYLHFRNRFIFTSFLYTGGRIGEINKIKWDDIDINKKRIKLLGKGDKTRFIPISKDFLLAILTYQRMLQELEGKGDFDLFSHEYVFNSSRNSYDKYTRVIEKPMTTRQIRRIIMKLYDLAGIKGKSPHSIRHTVGSILVKEDLASASEILGHSDKSITHKVYTHVLNQEQKELAIDNLDNRLSKLI